MEKRYCKICNGRLSESNKSDICRCHQTVPYQWTPVTLCTSYKPPDASLRESDYYVGSELYNKTAFYIDKLGFDLDDVDDVL